MLLSSAKHFTPSKANLKQDSASTLTLSSSNASLSNFDSFQQKAGTPKLPPVSLDLSFADTLPSDRYSSSNDIADTEGETFLSMVDMGPEEDGNHDINVDAASYTGFLRNEAAPKQFVNSPIISSKTLNQHQQAPFLMDTSNSIMRNSPQNKPFPLLSASSSSNAVLLDSFSAIRNSAPSSAKKPAADDWMMKFDSPSSREQQLQTSAPVSISLLDARNTYGIPDASLKYTENDMEALKSQLTAKVIFCFF